VPAVRVDSGCLRIDDVEIAFDNRDQRAFDTMMGLMQLEGDLHLYQTYHLVYPSGTRILTLGRRAPLPLVYRELAPLVVQLS
jgi:hypothetical protein